MPTFKTTWLFEDSLQKGGWSESWYVIAASKSVAHSNSLEVASKRLIAINGGVLLTAVRTTGNVPPFVPLVIRQADVLIDFLGWPGQAGSSFGGEDRMQIAAKTRFNNRTNEKFTVRMLRGLPDDGWNNNSDKIAKTLIQQMLASMVPAMKRVGFSFRHRDRSTPPITTFLNVEDGQYEGLSVRKTGRPFYLPRGRRFAKRTVK